MSDMNIHILVGRLGKDPELSDNGVCKFSLATGYVSKGEKKTNWTNIVCFDKTAENCAKYLSKGREVAIQGETRTREYEKDGRKQYFTETIAHRVQFVGSKSDAPAREPYSPPIPDKGYDGGGQDDGNDLPF